MDKTRLWTCNGCCGQSSKEYSHCLYCNSPRNNASYATQWSCTLCGRTNKIHSTKCVRCHVRRPASINPPPKNQNKTNTHNSNTTSNSNSNSNRNSNQNKHNSPYNIPHKPPRQQQKQQQAPPRRRNERNFDHNAFRSNRRGDNSQPSLTRAVTSYNKQTIRDLSLHIGDILRFCHKEHSHYAAYMGRPRDNKILCESMFLDANDPEDYVIHKYTESRNLNIHRMTSISRSDRFGMPFFLSEKKCSVTLDPLNKLWDNYEIVINETKFYDKLMMNKISLPPRTTRAIVESAIESLGKPGYNLLYKNCEHFVTSLRYGESFSRQVFALSTGVVDGAISGALIGTGIGGLAGAAIGGVVGAVAGGSAASYSMNGKKGAEQQIKQWQNHVKEEREFQHREHGEYRQHREQRERSRSTQQSQQMQGRQQMQHNQQRQQWQQGQQMGQRERSQSQQLQRQKHEMENWRESKEEESLLVGMFECAWCKKTMNDKQFQIELYQCDTCLNNWTEHISKKRDYYCLECIYLLHSRDNECKNHRAQLWSNNSRILIKLNLDMMTYKQARHDGMIEFQIHLREYMEDGYNDTWNKAHTIVGGITESFHKYVNIISNLNANEFKKLTKFDTYKTLLKNRHSNGPPIVKSCECGTVSNMGFGNMCHSFCWMTSGILLACDLGVTWWKYHNGEISWRQLEMRSFQGVITVISTHFAALFGTQIGAWLVPCIVGLIGIPGAGIGIVSTIGGIIGGLLLAWITGKGLKRLFDKVNGNDTERKRKQKQIEEALLFFGFNDKNMDKLTEEELRKRYLKLAKVYHPDRGNYDSKQFVELTVQYGILKSIVKSKSVTKEKALNSFLDDVMNVQFSINY